MLSEDITKLIGNALKSGDRVRLETLKMLASAFNYEKINLQHELTDEEEIVVIRKEAKQRRDSIEAYDKAGRSDLSASEKAELIILQEFLPPEMSDSELVELVDLSIRETGAKTIADMGKVIGVVKAKVGSSVDGGKVASLVRQKLT